MATLMRRPMAMDPQPSRAAQRKQRLLELENEQRLEDLEALKMTEEQRLILFHSFRSVKFEWSDLDGMRSVRRRYNSPPVHPPVQTRSPTPTTPNSPRPPPLQLHLASPPPSEAFAVLTNRHTSSCAVPFPQISIPFPSAESAPASPTPTITPRDAAWGTSLESTTEPTAKPVRTTKSTLRRSSSKARPPLKGLLPSPATTTLSVPSPIVVPKLPTGLGPQDDEDEDAWVDEDDEFDGNTTLRPDDDDEFLATPVAPQSWQLENALGVGVPYTYSGCVLPPTPTPANAEAEFHVGSKR
ncbi:hypothetical protein C8F01DRAFT_1120616, partial [Mycena amicta]